MLKSLSHLLLSGIFVIGGANAFIQPGGRVNLVDKAGIPEPERAVVLNGALMVAGGTLLGLNIAPKLAALILLGTLIPTTAVGHAFWNEENEANRRNHQTHFLKNLGLIGGLLLVLSE